MCISRLLLRRIGNRRNSRSSLLLLMPLILRPLLLLQPPIHLRNHTLHIHQPLVFLRVLMLQVLDLPPQLVNVLRRAALPGSCWHVPSTLSGRRMQLLLDHDGFRDSRGRRIGVLVHRTVRSSDGLEGAVVLHEVRLDLGRLLAVRMHSPNMFVEILFARETFSVVSLAIRIRAHELSFRAAVLAMDFAFVS